MYIYCRGYSRFVNVRDHKGATPLHLGARRRRPQCVHLLLENGALACASTGGYGKVFVVGNEFLSLSFGVCVCV